MVPIYEVFLVLHPVSSRFAELGHTLEHVIAGEPPIEDLDLHYRASADTALLALHYDERLLDGDALRRLQDTARGAGFALVDPSQLPDSDRRTFFEARLPQFEACGRGLRTAGEVCAALAARLGKPTGFARATPREGMPRLGSPGRLVVTVPPLPSLKQSLPVRPATLPPPPTMTPSEGTVLGKVAQRRPLGKARARTVTDRMGMTLAEQARQARRAAEALRARDPESTTDVVVVDVPPPVRDAPTEPVPSAVPELLPEAALDVHAAKTARLCGPHPRIGTDPVTELPAALDVRFLRGGDWVPARARALSAKGAYVVTSAPARLGDTVHVSVSCAGRTALVRGTVYHVTTADDALSTGASGFAVRFPEYACPARTHLIQVLLAARQAGITLRPPPTRTAVRFPVRWPVLLTVGGTSFRAEALDISSGGLFVATPRVIDVGADVRFTVTLDLAELPVEGRGRVSRSQEADATARGMHEGVGVKIVMMADADRARWDAFLGRVRRRTEKKVLIGAGPGRVEELAAGLVGAGYTVTSGSDLGLLMRVAELDPCPPDLAVIDADFDRTAAPAGWIEQVFAARRVQCVTVQGDVRRARTTVDKLLDVGG